MNRNMADMLAMMHRLDVAKRARRRVARDVAVRQVMMDVARHELRRRSTRSMLKELRARGTSA